MFTYIHIHLAWNDHRQRLSPPAEAAGLEVREQPISVEGIHRRAESQGAYRGQPRGAGAGRAVQHSNYTNNPR